MKLTYPEKLTTAVMIMLPPEVQKFAVPVISQYAPQMLQWYPGHITLFFPFVTFERLDVACRQSRYICASILPFQVALEGYGHFPKTTYMKVRDPQDIQSLFNSIFAHFPECPPYEGVYGAELQPHVTIGLFDEPAEQRAISFPDYPPIQFEVARLNVIYGSLDVPIPFVTYDVIPLGR